LEPAYRRRRWLNGSVFLRRAKIRKAASRKNGIFGRSRENEKFVMYPKALKPAAFAAKGEAHE
jgi:hypothetical protein